MVPLGVSNQLLLGATANLPIDVHYRQHLASFVNERGHSFITNTQVPSSTHNLQKKGLKKKSA